jgi:hypothetical protein
MPFRGLQDELDVLYRHPFFILLAEEHFPDGVAGQVFLGRVNFSRLVFHGSLLLGQVCLDHFLHVAALGELADRIGMDRGFVGLAPPELDLDEKVRVAHFNVLVHNDCLSNLTPSPQVHVLNKAAVELNNYF